jgi:myo-inositol-1-phosphate synthase
MTDSTRRSVIVRVPPGLKRRLAREVARGGKSMNDLAVGILGRRFGVEVEESGRRSTPPGTSGVVVLRMPDELKHRLANEARSLDSTTNDVIVRTLSETLGVRSRKETMAASNGNSRSDDGKVRVAIIGVGNCASALVQGIEYYKNAAPDEFVPGLMHVDVGGYHVRDVEFTAAFDVTKDKVGKDLADAIWAHPNNTTKFADVPKSGVRVSRGMTHDGLGKYVSEIVEKAPGETDDVVGILRETGTDVVVNFLPVGSEAATKWYTEQILDAGCAMVNCMPVFIARESYWQKRFEDAGLPIIGDDIKSQVGATISHRVLTTLYRKRGIKLDRTFQLNFGGNADFMNMLERERLESKKISKTNSIKSTLDYDLGEKNIHVGPSDHVPWLEDRKWAYIRLEGTGFGDVPLNIELKIEVHDSPNSAGIVIDAVRLSKLALNNGISGALEGPAAYFMKSPPHQYDDDEAHDLVEDFIRANKRKTSVAPAESSA